jgi:hypothetical protein
MPERRYKGYYVSQFRGDSVPWVVWIVTPDARNVFLQGETFEEAEQAATEFVDLELLNRLKEGCHQ